MPPVTTLSDWPARVHSPTGRRGANRGLVGKITRYRLNRGGDRQGNRALYLLAVGRMGWDPATKAYVERRTAEGRTKPEIIRCLKRYIARELYPVLLAATSTLVPASGSSNPSKAA